MLRCNWLRNPEVDSQAIASLATFGRAILVGFAIPAISLKVTLSA